MATTRAKRNRVDDLAHLPLDGIIRVSRLAGRDIESERYHTEDYQEGEIRKALKERGRELGKLYIERDVGAKTKKHQDYLEEAMGRVGTESGGICVAYLSRFGRTAGQTILLVNELNQRGATFITADGKFDTTTSHGKAMLGFMAILAEMELDRITENWETVVGRTIEQGRYIAGAVPTGYLMGEDGRLLPDPETSHHIAQLFAYRAEGWSWGRLCDYLEENDVVPPSAKIEKRNKRGQRVGWSRTSVSSLIKNPAYMGWARQQGDSYDFVNREAHEPLVSEEMWRLAQSSGADGRSERNGDLSSKALVRGIAVCQNCGYKLLVRGRTIKKSGERVPMYTCDRRHATGYCEKPANIDHRKLDPYIEAEFLNHIAARVSAKKLAVDDPEKLVDLTKQLETARRMLDYWVKNDSELVEDLGGDDEAFGQYRAQLREKRASIAQAKEALELERDRQSLVNEAMSGDLLDHWDDLDSEQKRRLLQAAIDRIEIDCAEGRRGWAAPPVEERATIVWHSGF